MAENIQRPGSGLDTMIKILTILKLLIEISLWGLFLGVTIYFLLNNPIPKLMNQLLQQAQQGLTGSLNLPLK